MRRNLFLFVMATVAFRLWACQCGPLQTSDAGTDTGAPLSIFTTTLPFALASESYNQPLVADGGTGIYTWTFASSVPASLSWLTISNSELTGIPNAIVSPGETFTVQVTDSADASVQQVLSLAVTCSGTGIPCFVPNGIGCEQGTQDCNGGQLTACTGLDASTTILHCEPNDAGVCMQCNALKATECNGTCMCGSTPACPAGDNNHCCTGDGGFCADFNAPESCGTCDNNCHTNTGSRRNVDAGCIASTASCDYLCNAGFADCNGDGGVLTGNDSDGCETSLHGTTNCGSCGYNCDSHLPQHAHTTSCDGVACQYTCDTNWGYCPALGDTNGNCTTDLTQLTSCGSCTNNCEANPPVNTIAASCNVGACEYACTGNYGSCNPDAGCTFPPPTNGHGVGSCVSPPYKCDPGYSVCGTECVDLQSDDSHCGLCTTVCSGTYNDCFQGGCTQSCNGGENHCTPGSGPCAAGKQCLGTHNCGAVMNCGGFSTCSIPTDCP